MQSQWRVLPIPEIPEAFGSAVGRYAPTSGGKYAAQLLWQLGIQDLEQLPGFLDPQAYNPASPFEFGQEMKWAVQRLMQARDRNERVTIWGDFDADGVTSTSVLWEGLGQFFPQQQQLNYYIPNRFTESHGLNKAGIERLAAEGTTLIVTCDTGSTNVSEINYASSLGIEIIVTDHHALPAERPEGVAMINPRYFAESHPLYHLSGVAVAYKLVEAMYAMLPEIPSQPLEDLLDLVAIGLIADLVQLRGDCRYLAQRGIQRLQTQVRTPTRPGVAKLLELCRRSGDRPTDISFGLGPRINAVSRIHGDAHFCVELLTSRDRQRCGELAMETELANARRKELQKNVEKSVKQKLERVDLSTCSVIVLEDAQWSVGVLGLVAGQIAQEYGRPTVLLSAGEEGTQEGGRLARGSARSVGNIDLYELVKSQEALLHRFGGHPLAAGLSLPVENIPRFREALDRLVKTRMVGGMVTQPIVQADLTVRVGELGKGLFEELSLLEPCGMGNPIPRLLMENCWFEKVGNQNVADAGGRKVQYIKTHFRICDESCRGGFAGVWWGHYREELPQGARCDAIAQLDFNKHLYDRDRDYAPSQRGYEIRLVAVRLAEAAGVERLGVRENAIADWRGTRARLEEVASSYFVLQDCPLSWNELYRGVETAIAQSRSLALAYPPPLHLNPKQLWLQLLGIAKYLSRTGERATRARVAAKLGLSRPTVEAGLAALSALGFEVECDRDEFRLRWHPDAVVVDETAISAFLACVEEEQFKRQYFYRVPLATVQAMVGNRDIVSEYG